MASCYGGVVTSPLAPQIRANPGSPASVRVGVVVSTEPAEISLQGTILSDVGIVGSYTPQVGDSVILLGQSSDAGPDPASWVALGSATPQGMRALIGACDFTTNLSAAELNLPGTEIDFDTTAPLTMVQAWWTCDFDVFGATATTAVCRPQIDGIVQTSIQAILEMPVAAAVGRWTLGNQAIYMVGPGSHSMSLFATAGVANMIRAVAGSTVLMVNVYG